MEMAILLPFIAFLFLIAIDFCRIFHVSQTVQSAAETAALYAGGTAQPPPNTSAATAAQQAAVADAAMLNPPLGLQDVAVDIASDTATVTVTYPFQTLIPYPGLPPTLTLVRTAKVSRAPQVGQGN